MHHLGKLVQVRWDVYHRSIRDVKLSLLHACKGQFLQAQMYSQYLWAVSYRPYNNSGFHEDKIRCLEVMLAREEPESFELFHEFWETIRDDLQMPASSTMQDVWRKIPTTETFASKMTLPKLGRWFSWNQACEEQLSSWHILKMVLAYHFWDKDMDPDVAAKKRELDAIARMSDENQEEKVNARKQFNLLKEKLGGGLKLAYFLMSTRLLQQIHILSMVTRPIWSWYAGSVKTINNCDDHVARLVSLATQWQRDPHLQETAAVPTARSHEMLELLHRREFEEVRADTAKKTLDLTVHLLKHRTWSLSRASAPPDCYAELLHPDVEKQQVRCRCLVLWADMTV